MIDAATVVTLHHVLGISKLSYTQHPLIPMVVQRKVTRSSERMVELLRESAT